MAFAFNDTTKEFVGRADPNRPPFNAPPWITGGRAGSPVVLGQMQALIAAAVPFKYWKVSAGDVVEMTAGEKAAVDTAELPGIKLRAIASVRARVSAYLEGRGYPPDTVQQLLQLHADAVANGLAARVAYLAPFRTWLLAPFVSPVGILNFQRLRRAAIVAAATAAGVTAAQVFSLPAQFDAGDPGVDVETAIGL